MTIEERRVLFVGHTGRPEALRAVRDAAQRFSNAGVSVRVLAENLDKRTAEISAGLTKFTGSGLREWEQLAVDGRKTLAQLDRAVHNFDRNPSRVIFGGGGGVPEYNGRR